MKKQIAAGLLWSLVTGMAVGTAPAMVMAADESGAVDIEASEMEILDANNQAIFRGDVVAKRPADTIRSDVMVATYVDVKQPDGSMKQEVDVLDCKGNVSIVTDTQTLTGETAKFYVRRDELVMNGNVKVVQGTTVVRGQKLTADLKTKHTVVSGGRVKGKFVPK